MKTARPAQDADAIAPDGSEVRMLVGCDGASMAEFRLRPGNTSVAVAHRTLEEMWYVVAGIAEISGRGEVYFVRGPWTPNVRPGAEL